jgi:two-component system, sensor histidine kinase and response regulator
MDKILIIEDDELIRENMIELFSNEGYIVHTASDGKSGIQKARQVFPDLILSDIMMPELDGFQVYKNLRIDPQLSVIPFIFLSALSDKVNYRFGMGLGADDYITKPFVNSELLDVAKSRIEKSKFIKKSMEELKLNLIRSVPHEFFTPLNAVLGFSQLLIDGTKEIPGLTTEEILEYSEYINSAGKKLLRITRNYVLFNELSLISKGNSIDESIRSEFSDDIHLFLPQYIFEYAKAEKRENDLEVSFEIATLYISNKNLKKIIEELLDNAIKFSNLKSIIRIKGICEGNFYLITVEDQGKGMQKEDIQRIESFVHFERNSSDQSGLGLGLPLIIKLINVLQGKIRIESIKNKGTKIEVRIPIYTNSQK